MRAFMILIFGLLFGSVGGIIASHVSPTKEALAPYIERVLALIETDLPLDIQTLQAGQTVFQPSQLTPLGIEPCFPRAAAYGVTERPWLQRDIGDNALTNTRLDPFPDLSDYPGLIKIEGIRSTIGTQREHCAAVRVSEHWFLTAAHCIVDLDIETAKPTYDVIAVTPATDVRSEEIKVQSLYGAVCHSAYGMNRQQYPNDVALFYLSDVSAFSDVAIARLESPESGLLPRDLSQVYIAGWGRNGGTQYLQGGHVHMSEAGEAVLVADKIGRRGPNVGDSGAPLYASTPDGPLVVGVLSQVTQDRDQNGERSIYVRVKSVYEWVQMTMAVCEQEEQYVCGAGIIPTAPTGLELSQPVN